MSSRVYSLSVAKSLRSVSGICGAHSVGVSCSKRHFLISDNCYQKPYVDLFPRTRASFSFRATRERFPSNQKFVFKNDADKFGSSQDEANKGDKGDLIEEERLTYPVSRKLRIKQYADIIKAHLKKKEFAEAIDVLETRMLKEDKVKPDNYLYSLLIGACGRIGYSKKAFHLYNEMKKRGLKVNEAVYTGLFNSCANSPFPDEALKQARHLQGIMVEKGIQPNETHYNAMIKAYGRCGDVAGAFKLVDEMVDHNIELTSGTYSFLFQACVSDTVAGFRHAILVWHNMIRRGHKPNVFLFNVLLRCVRDCGLGSISEAEKTFQQLTAGATSSSKSETSESSSSSASAGFPTSKAAAKTSAAIVCETDLEEAEFTNVSSVFPSDQINLPNLLAPVPHLGSIVAVSAVTEPHDKLLLLGGSGGFFNCMEQFAVHPDIKTITLLLDCIPPTLSAEKAFLSKVKKLGIKLDIDFYNMLIKRRSFRLDYESAQNVLHMISAQKLLPDIVTFGVLALSCKTIEEAQQVIHDMKCAGYRTNEEILGAMLRQACCQFNFKYAMKILYLAKEEGIKPTPRFIKIIDAFVEKCQGYYRQKVKGEAVPIVANNHTFKVNSKKFFFQYKAWLDEMGGKDNIKEPHPWEQFRKR